MSDCSLCVQARPVGGWSQTSSPGTPSTQRSRCGPTALLSTKDRWGFQSMILQKTLLQFGLPHGAHLLLGVLEVDRAVCPFEDICPSSAAPGHSKDHAEAVSFI